MATATKGKAMGKRKYRTTTGERSVKMPKAEPRAFVPRPCGACETLRDGKNYTRVYSVTKAAGCIIRYCRCDFCGNTFKDTELSRATGTNDAQEMQDESRHDEQEVAADDKDQPHKATDDLSLVDLPQAGDKET